MSHSFKGGVHPNYMKAPDVPETVIPAPPQVVIPMAQHIGAPCVPVVKVGDYVTMGQKVGENPAPVSAPVHSSVSGKVVAIEPRPHPLGDMIMSVVIENDYQDTPCTDMEPLTEEQLRDPNAILARIREAGVVGMGGAMFPTAFKIRGGIGKVDKLIINGAECEPYLNGDHLTMRNYPEQLLRGIELVRIASGLDHCYYGIEVNKQDAIDILMAHDPAKYGIEIVPEAVKYPQGGEKMQVNIGIPCDPIPGGREFPCITRTIRAAVTMPLYADMALCSMDPIIPYHEMLAAIQHHKQIASRECLHGGVNVCPAACWCADFLAGELMADKLKYEAPQIEY